MREIIVETIEGDRLERVYEINELSYMGKLLSCKESRRRGISYLEIPCAFDIETTNIYELDKDGNIETKKRPYAYMYHWQFCFGDEVCFGRTWAEFRKLLLMLEKNLNLSSRNRLVVYVHNLPFEFQFMRRFINVLEGFYKEAYKPLKVVTDGGIEFRCSYALSNMTLEKFCENERNVIHYKLSGDDYNYKKLRTSQSSMTQKEQAYCYNDVRGLCECIQSRMSEDTLASMPMTSTGYVRRDMRRNMTKNPANRIQFKEMRLSAELYEMCREAFRGGDTHANPRHSMQIMDGVNSYDIASSYPACMIMKKFPSGPFVKISAKSFRERDLSGFALLFRVRLKNCRYVGTCGNPYISRSKCTAITKDYVPDNGRVVFASWVEMTITDIDWHIINHEYKFEEYWLKDIYCARYDYMPEEFRQTVMKYYKGKCELKGIEKKLYEYNKSKAYLNSCYGMQCMRIDQTLTVYEDGEYKEKEEDLKETLDRYYKSRNSFLSYQQGVWVTAWARLALRKMLWKVGKNMVYCDTDSVKCTGGYSKDFDEMNAEIMAEAEKAGAFAFDSKGKKRYLGVWEYEGRYDDQGFVTLGAKKYAYKKDGRYYSTIAGVSRKAGAEYFEENGLEGMYTGAKIRESGHLTAFYNDSDIHEIEVEGVKMETASNVALVDNTYTIGITNDYFLTLLEKTLDKQAEVFYI